MCPRLLGCHRCRRPRESSPPQGNVRIGHDIVFVLCVSSAKAMSSYSWAIGLPSPIPNAIPKEQGTASRNIQTGHKQKRTELASASGL